MVDHLSLLQKSNFLHFVLIIQIFPPWVFPSWCWLLFKKKEKKKICISLLMHFFFPQDLTVVSCSVNHVIEYESWTKSVKGKVCAVMNNTGLALSWFPSGRARLRQRMKSKTWAFRCLFESLLMALLLILPNFLVPPRLPSRCVLSLLRFQLIRIIWSSHKNFLMYSNNCYEIISVGYTLLIWCFIYITNSLKIIGASKYLYWQYCMNSGQSIRNAFKNII